MRHPRARRLCQVTTTGRLPRPVAYVHGSLGDAALVERDEGVETGELSRLYFTAFLTASDVSSAAFLVPFEVLSAAFLVAFEVSSAAAFLDQSLARSIDFFTSSANVGQANATKVAATTVLRILFMTDVISRCREAYRGN
jgi:hypothetical protein